jgi:hypothetical protein
MLDWEFKRFLVIIFARVSRLILIDIVGFLAGDLKGVLIEAYFSPETTCYGISIHCHEVVTSMLRGNAQNKAAAFE